MANYGTSTIPGNAKQFIDGVLVGIQAPVNAQTEKAMYWWLANEQGGPGLTAFTHNQGNPLGVQTPEAQAAGRTGDVQGGIDATVQNLLAGSGSGGYYHSLVAALRKGTSATAIAQQIVQSPWNGHHYSGITTFLKTAGASTAGVTQGLLFPVSPVAAGADPGNPAATTPGSNTIAGTSDTGTGCSGKTPVFGGLDIKVTTIGGISACQGKAILGAAALVSGGIIMILGISLVAVGTLGGKGGTAAQVVAGVTPVGRAAKATGRAAGGQYKKNKAADAAKAAA
jgi:hypothetical protein